MDVLEANTAKFHQNVEDIYGYSLIIKIKLVNASAVGLMGTTAAYG